MRPIGLPLDDADVTRPCRYASTAQVVGDYPAADTEGGAELLRALAADVSLDEVLSVGRREFRGHVWDLTTEPSWFYANGIVTHNCRPWEGKIVSLTGRTAPGTYRANGATYTVTASLQDAIADGLHHPNCRHREVLYQPGVTRRMTDTADPEGDRLRQQQRYMERRVRQLKREAAVTDEIDPAAATAAKAKLRSYQADFKAWRDANGRKNLSYRTSLKAR